MKNLLPILFVFSGLAFAQKQPFVQATGTGAVTIIPDLATIDVGVTTMAMTAQDSGNQNATLTTAVIAAMQQLVGATGQVKTVGYSVNQNFRYPPNGGTPTLVGYNTTNSLEATTSDLSLPGKIIDAAVAAGATAVNGLRFSLKDSTAATAQALKMATAVAKSQADAMASGIGVHTGTVRAILQGSSSTPILRNVATADAGASTPTPIDIGTLQVTATVTIEADLVQ